MLASYLSTQIGPTATESGGQPVWAASAMEAIATQPVVINQGSARMGPSSQQRQCHGGLVPRAECRCSAPLPYCKPERLCSRVVSARDRRAPTQPGVGFS